MKLGMFLVLTSVLLSGCSTAPISLNDKVIAAVAPDIAVVPLATQQAAANEMAAGTCPALNTVASAALMTLDEARAMKTKKVPK